MRLPLFDFVDETVQLLNLNQPTYQYIQGLLEKEFDKMLIDKKEILVDFNSRVKSEDSLKEKIIRNKYYLKYSTAEEALEHLPDLIGLTLECRFISEEDGIYEEILKKFIPEEDGFYQCIDNSTIFLDLSQKQPQFQRNGFTIYRIDGYVKFSGKKVNFELQIKSLIHRFWSEVEHQVVYKNTQFILYDNFMKNILGSIRDNLEVVDHQLETVYKQISSEKVREDEIGLGENGFKLFIAKSINDLVSIKMHQAIGFTTNFKKCSAILSQYIYIKDFINSENPQYKMAEYIEHFNLLKRSEVDFTENLKLEKDFTHWDPFCIILGSYWKKVINTDYEWHVFFIMVFAIQPGNNIQDFTQFVEIIKSLLIPPTWMRNRFIHLNNNRSKEVREEVEAILAETLIRIGKIDMVHEEKVFKISQIFQKLVEELETQEVIDVPQFKEKINDQISKLF